jgi:oligoribonuclease NrnB/cAMP/cGMP phosphodiesterase (DHH superfamily)
MENLKEIVVIYHAHCQDGFGSAFAAYKKFGDEATYIAARDRKVPPEGLANKEVYIVDFSYPKEVLVSLQENNKKVVMIDHHISAQEDIKYLMNMYFRSNTPEHTCLGYISFLKKFLSLLRHLK